MTNDNIESTIIILWLIMAKYVAQKDELIELYSLTS